MNEVNKLLIAIDDTKASKMVIPSFMNLLWKPKSVILLYVVRLQGRSLMIDMLGEAEMSTLKESLKGTDYQKTLNEKAGKVIEYYKNKLENAGTFSISTVVRTGRPVDEILKVAEEEKVDQILLGYKEQKGFSRLLTGSVVRDVQKNAKIPVLLACRPLMCEEPYSWKDAYAAVTVTTVIVFAMFLLGIILQKGLVH